MQQAEIKKSPTIAPTSIKNHNLYISYLPQFAEVRGKYSRPAVNVVFNQKEQQSRSLTNNRPKTGESRIRQGNFIHEFDPFISYLEKSSKIGLNSLNEKKRFNEGQINDKKSSKELNKVKIASSKARAEITASVKKQNEDYESQVITKISPKEENSFSKSVDGRKTSKSFNSTKAKYVKELEDLINQEKFYSGKLQQKISSLV